MVEARFKAAVIPRLDAMPTIQLIEKLLKAIAKVSTSLKTKVWGGLHGCLALILQETEVRHVTNDHTLDCNRTENPPFTHPDINLLTTVT